MIQAVTYDTYFQTPETVTNGHTFLMHVYACVYIYKTYIYMKYLWAETEPLVPEGFIIYVNPFHRGTTFKSLAEEVALARVWGQALLAEFTSDNDPWRG